VLVGGWTAFAASIAMWAADPGSVSMTRGLRYTPDIVYALGFAAMAQPLGMLLGTLAAFVVAVVPAGTRTDRSVPLIFLPMFVVGAIGSLFDPLLGLFAAGFIGVLMSVVASRTCRIIPQGHCQKCGYDLTGSATGTGVVCPECGSAVVPERVWPFRT
jgi:hypothetical protein